MSTIGKMLLSRKGGGGPGEEYMYVLKEAICKTRQLYSREIWKIRGSLYPFSSSWARSDHPANTRRNLRMQDTHGKTVVLERRDDADDLHKRVAERTVTSPQMR